MFKRIHVLRLALAAALFFTATAGSAFAADDTAESGPYKTCSTCTKAGSVEKGTVPVVGGYSDIYARQVEYKQSAKEFRASIVARQESYEAPRRESLELYRQYLEAAYKAESQEYQKKVASEAEAAAEAAEMKKAEGVVDDAGTVSEGDIPAPEMSEDGETASETAESNEGVKEKVLEPVEEGEVKVKKKIIMPEDAPDFDEAPF